MELEYNKINVAYIVLILHVERRKGIFFNDLMYVIKRKLEDKTSRNARDNPGSIARSTFHNYFKRLSNVVGDDFNGADSYRVAHELIEKDPKLVDIFYRKITEQLFKTIRDFLIENRYLGDFSPAKEAASSPNSLFFALTDFLADRTNPDVDITVLPGDYKVFRPSLSVPGMILVSCARIEAQKDGALRYLERMHFKHPLSWRSQILEGYVVSAGDHYFLTTKDSNTPYLQSTILHVRHRETSTHEGQVIKVMTGTYSGFSRNHSEGFFSTGIVLVRTPFRGLSKHDIRKWKIGWISGFGLISPDEVEPELLRHIQR